MAVRFQILSDLHIDSYARRGLPVEDIPNLDVDAIIVAGDTSNSDMGIHWLIEQSQRLAKPIFVITGNHDYYGEDIYEFDEHLKATTQGTLVNYLQADSVDFMGVRLLGVTLWTDFKYHADASTLAKAIELMRDYKEIRNGEHILTPQDSIDIHYQHRQWLHQQLLQAKQQQVSTVVITHHSISPNSISKQYAHLPSNAGFVTDFSEWLQSDFAPKVWIHGHTHEAFDYVQGNTRVVVNPRAYPNEVSSTGIVFDWNKIIEVA